MQMSINFSWDEALAQDVVALGGRKKLAPRLWPADDEETRQERLKACLSPGHKMEFKPQEILRIKEWARDVGSYALVNYEAHYLGHRVEWIEPQDEADQIRRELRDEFRSLNQKMDRLERVEQRAQMRAVK